MENSNGDRTQHSRRRQWRRQQQQKFSHIGAAERISKPLPVRLFVAMGALPLESTYTHA